MYSLPRGYPLRNRSEHVGFQHAFLSLFQADDGKSAGVMNQQQNGGGQAAAGQEPDEVQAEPLDMSFPRHGWRKQLTYVLLFPLVFPLWLTLPDTRKPSSK